METISISKETIGNQSCFILLVVSRWVLMSKRQRQIKEDLSNPNQSRLFPQAKFVEPKETSMSKITLNPFLPIY